MKEWFVPFAVVLAASGCGDSPSPTGSSPALSISVEERASSLSAVGPHPHGFSLRDSPSARAALELRAPSQSLAADVPFRTILCFGDSITYGVTLQSGFLPQGAHADLTLVEGYVPKLWRRLEQKYGSGFELVNSGIPGETSTEGRRRLPREIRTYDPDIVLLLQGVVDVNGSNPRFPVVRENLAEMMRIVIREGKHPIIGTYLLLNPEGFRGTSPENVLRLNDIIRQEAQAQNVVVADHARALSDLSGQGPDGLHPNNIGYEAMADTWLAAIEALAERVSGT